MSIMIKNNDDNDNNNYNYINNNYDNANAKSNDNEMSDQRYYSIYLFHEAETFQIFDRQVENFKILLDKYLENIPDVPIRTDKKHR